MIVFMIVSYQSDLNSVASGKHALVIEAQLGSEGSSVVQDDQNPLWEDVEDDDDPILLARQILDDQENGETEPPHLSDAELKQRKDITASKARHFFQRQIHFNVFWRQWRSAMVSFASKQHHLSRCGTGCYECVAFPVVDADVSIYDSHYDSQLTNHAL